MMPLIKIGQLKFFFRLAVVCFQLALLTLCFWFCWEHYYEVLLSQSYGPVATLALLGVYFFVLIFSTCVYGGTKYAYYQTEMLLLSQILAMVVTNALTFLILVFALHCLPPILPMAILTFLDVLLLLLSTKMAMPFFRKVYPPKKLLLICRSEFLNEAMGKLQTRKDLFHIQKVLPAELELSEIFDAYTANGCNAIMIDGLESQKHGRMIKQCYEKDIRLYAVPRIPEILLQNSDRIHAFDTPLLLMRNDGLPYVNRIIKRSLDLAICLPALILLSPILLLTAFAIKIEDGGSVFFRQERVTIGGKHFKVLKFRSMRMDAEKNGAQFASQNDSRVTRVGNFIRKTRIDELPQILNVLSGEMSIVGPRPERPVFVEKFSLEMPEFVYRQSVKAGITGYAQIYGKYNTSPIDKLKLDLMYIRNQSLVVDLKIILLTIRTMFTPSAAEGFSKERSSEINAAAGKQ
ncbi:MAG: exopolysaccharide biosynthesis polyprenyl glycosylphosphotransferase [Opitutales bacterium]|nr:exopolysaccharide biosynthesis polyprenyl glycosylphosphotransferase [Opitutales bacterium]